MIVVIFLLLIAVTLLGSLQVKHAIDQAAREEQIAKTFTEIEGIIIEFADINEKSVTTLANHINEQSFWIKSIYYDFFNHLYRTHHLIKDDKGHLQAHKPNWSADAELKLHKLGVEVKKEYLERGLNFDLGTPAGMDLGRDNDSSHGSSSLDDLD